MDGRGIGESDGKGSQLLKGVFYQASCHCGHLELNPARESLGTSVNSCLKLSKLRVKGARVLIPQILCVIGQGQLLAVLIPQHLVGYSSKRRPLGQETQVLAGGRLQGALKRSEAQGVGHLQCNKINFLFFPLAILSQVLYHLQSKET